MRSSKSRSRSKSNRQRSPMGNIVNRVFDSSGPEGKVRGTPQQIIDKYLTLARDAQLGNDRVAAENFLQHAEHYARMLGEAQRELDSQRRDQGGNDQPRGDGNDDARGDDRGERGDDRQDRSRDDRQDRGRGDDRQHDSRNRDDRPRDDRPREDRPREDRNRDDRPREDRNRDDRGSNRQAGQRARQSEDDVIDLESGDGPGLVETPEMRRGVEATLGLVPAAESDTETAAKPAREPRPRRPRRPKAEVQEAEAAAPAVANPGGPSEAAE